MNITLICVYREPKKHFDDLVWFYDYIDECSDYMKCDNYKIKKSGFIVNGGSYSKNLDGYVLSNKPFIEYTEGEPSVIVEYKNINKEYLKKEVEYMQKMHLNSEFIISDN